MKFDVHRPIDGAWQDNTGRVQHGCVGLQKVREVEAATVQEAMKLARNWRDLSPILTLHE
jgi:hypothetical protein